MTLRKVIIKTKIAEINDSLKLVKDNLPSSLSTFKKMGLMKDGIYKRMEYAIENVFDICSIINSDLKLGVPVDNEDILNNLYEADVIDNITMDKLKSMKGFRNILVHRYGKIEDDMAFKILNANLDYFDHFLEVIEEFMKKNNH
ncbi:MAG: type VII toxin-antitoxin system HepT family RNase toxin [Methanomicrobiales archaeon]